MPTINPRRFSPFCALQVVCWTIAAFMVLGCLYRRPHYRQVDPLPSVAGRVEAGLPQWCEEHGVARAVSVVTVGGEVRLTAYPPEAAGDVFAVGSVGKLVTVLAAVSLIEEGALNWDTPVSSVLGEIVESPLFRDVEPIRVRHLMSHTAGLDDSGSQRWPAGLAWNYSNGGYGLLARVVAASAGKPFPEVAAERVLEPLGMTTSHFAPDPHPLPLGAGRLMATPVEVTSLLNVFAQREHPLLHYRARASLLRSIKLPSGERVELGFVPRDRFRYRWTSFRLTGSTHEGSAEVFVSPYSEFAGALLTDGIYRAAFYREWEKALGHMAGRGLGEATRGPVPLGPLGTFQSPHHGRTLIISFDDAGDLVMTEPESGRPAKRLNPEHGGAFYLLGEDNELARALARATDRTVRIISDPRGQMAQAILVGDDYYERVGVPAGERAK